jgi:hypothetical protein
VRVKLPWSPIEGSNPLSEDGLSDFIASFAPLLDRGVEALGLGESDPAIERDPAHHFRVDELSRFAPDLPDPAAGFVPDLTDVFDQPADGRPGFFRKGLPVAGGLLDGEDEFAVDVELALLACGVADPNGARPAIALEAVEHFLLEIGLAAKPIQRTVEGLVEIDDFALG